MGWIHKILSATLQIPNTTLLCKTGNDGFRGLKKKSLRDYHHVHPLAGKTRQHKMPRLNDSNKPWLREGLDWLRSAIQISSTPYILPIKQLLYSFQNKMTQVDRKNSEGNEVSLLKNETQFFWKENNFIVMLPWNMYHSKVIWLHSWTLRVKALFIFTVIDTVRTAH